MSLVRYEAYKASGLDWLEDIPSNWGLLRLGSVFSERSEKVSDKDFAALSVTQKGIVPQLEDVAKTDAGDNRKKVCVGDFVINSRSDRKGSSGVSEYEGSVSLISIVLKATKIEPVFAHHLLRSKLFQEEFYRFGKGIHADLWSTNYSEMKNILIPLPSINEQTQIARFLDHEVGKIDALIAEQEKLIALLKEKRQAVISHAVTKGLNPDTPMKDSGVEWLGQVPEHWVVGSLKWYATIRGGIALGKSYEGKETVTVPYLRVANVQAGYVDLRDVKEIEVLPEELEKYSLKSGEVLMNEGGDNNKLGRGTVWRCEIQPCIHQNHVFAITTNHKLMADWLALSSQSDAARAYFYVNSKQSTNLASISSSNVMGFVLPIPPMNEQDAILNWCTDALDRFDELVNEAESAKALLSERRSALISAAVTGKIDVRGWQPPVGKINPANKEVCVD
jgi:type I restriction enzyme S subunit